MAAEGGATSSRTGTTTCSNGAAAGWPRKVGIEAMAARTYFALQWGRGRMAAEGICRRAVPIRY